MHEVYYDLLSATEIAVFFRVSLWRICLFFLSLVMHDVWDLRSPTGKGEGGRGQGCDRLGMLKKPNSK